MPSATSAASSDSIAPSRVKLMAHGSAAVRVATETGGNVGWGSMRGNAPKRLAMVCTGRSSAATTAAAAATAISRLGARGDRRLMATISSSVPSETPIAAGGGGCGMDGPQGFQLLHQLARLGCGQGQAEQILDLAGKDDHRDTGAEADGDGIGDEQDISSGTEKGQRDQEQARQHGGKDQPFDPDLRDAGRDQNDEGPRRAADLEPRSAQHRHQKPADDGGEQASFRPDPAGYGDGH